MNCFLGIDTSCYTTSVAVVDEAGQLLADCRRLLTVKPGGRGLAQSEMVFQHTRNLPELFEEAITKLGDSYRVIGISVSSRPRPVADSYMPAFLVGQGYARVLGAALKVKVTPLSHQENHIYAGIWSAMGPVGEHFLALHLSGGTTEILEIRNWRSNPGITLLGGSQDLHAGQFVDRVGVALGLPFPAGPSLERLAESNRGNPVVLPFSIRNLTASFSGPESQAQRFIAQGLPSAAIADGVQQCIARTVVELINQAVERTSLQDVLLAGGVTANAFIRRFVEHKVSKQAIRLYIPDSAYSTDNAVGTAYFASRVAAQSATA